MKYFISLSLLLITGLIQADIYRGVDKSGNVFYSDKEQDNAKLIPTPTPNTISMPKLEPAKATEKEPQEKFYTAFSIVHPDNDATIKDNTGNLTVKLLIKPELNIKKGDYIRLYIDNRVAITKTTSLNPQLSNLVRGSHTLKAELVNSKGAVLLTHSTQFHMKRFSQLH